MCVPRNDDDTLWLLATPNCRMNKKKNIIKKKTFKHEIHV